ncbi:hypothetical protein Scep_003262 [Stephania cephalantha]|uniref:ABC transporter domain-containing protein n=1 Tax=Stephania cephalantha TaxID=152367 RepID=A0AAP0KQ60_9MAGN
MMYGQNAIAINEFLDKRWSTPIDDPVTHETTVGKVLLRSRGMFVQEYWYWICIGALFGFALLFNACFVVALTWLNPIGSKNVAGADEDYENRNKTSASCEHLSKATEINLPSKAPISEDIDMEVNATSKGSKSTVNAAENIIKRGMVLPSQSLSMAFNHMNYYVDMPPEMQKQGIEGSRLQLLRDVSGAFKPGVLTALVGVSGAGKTTLMDVLAGRKTGGYIEGSIYIAGFPKDQATFARVSGYCEQDDIHSPNVTVYESLLYSAWLRLAPEVKKETRKMFVEEVMTLLELNPIKNALVGQPGVDGLSLEQRKRLTIAVELVANPSIIFMDEPTSGLDARAAAIVMRTVRNTADTGRTVVCTIHQPSIDIFEAFDELMLMKRGGQVIYAGPLGRCSQYLVEYFEAIPGVPKIRDGYNPATWMLEVTTPAIEAQLKVDFADVYMKSTTYKRNQELIKELSMPVAGSKDLYFPTKYAQNSAVQFIACFWRQYWSYWRNSQHNVARFLVTIVISVIFGIIYWNRGNKTSKQQDLLNLLGGIVTAVSTLGPTNAAAAQALMIIERTTFFRERAAGMYSALPHAFAQVAVETIYLFIQTIIFTVPLYAMLGFSWQGEKFLWFFYFSFMSFVYFVVYSMMVVALSSGHQTAFIIMSFFYNFWILFCGYVIPRSQIPVWWRWFYWCSPISWTIYGIETALVGDKNNLLDIPGQEFRPSVKAYLKEYFGFNYSFLGYVGLAHAVFVVMFFAFYVIGIKFINFQRR